MKKNVTTVRKQGILCDNCYYLKGFPPTHPLHGVFLKIDKEKFIKYQGKKGEKGYLAESSKETEKDTFSDELLTKLKQMMESRKEEAKANLATGNFFPFTTFLTFVK